MTGYEATERTSGKSHESNRVIWDAPFPLRDLLKVPIPSRRFSELLLFLQKVDKILLLRLFINQVIQLSCGNKDRNTQEKQTPSNQRQGYKGGLLCSVLLPSTFCGFRLMKCLLHPGASSPTALACAEDSELLLQSIEERNTATQTMLIHISSYSNTVPTTFQRPQSIYSDMESCI